MILETIEVRWVLLGCTGLYDEFYCGVYTAWFQESEKQAIPHNQHIELNFVVKWFLIIS